MRDPDGANLDRVQVIKGWLDDAGKTHEKVYDVALSDGSEVVASHANYSQGLHTLRDQDDREKLFKAHFTVYDGSPNTYAAIYNGVLQKDWFTARSRRYGSALEAKLDNDNIPVEVFEDLIKTARTGAGPLQRYQKRLKSCP